MNKAAIESLKPFLVHRAIGLQSEWYSGNFEKLFICPSYKSTKALVDAIHTLEKDCYGSCQTGSIRDIVTNPSEVIRICQ